MVCRDLKQNPLRLLVDWFRVPYYSITRYQTCHASFGYRGFGGRLLADETRDPHSNNSLLVSSLCTITSMKHKRSFFSPVAFDMASSRSSSVLTYRWFATGFASSTSGNCYHRIRGLSYIDQCHHELTLQVQHLPSLLLMASTSPV